VRPRRHAVWLALARAAFGAPAVAAPEGCLRLLGLSRGRRPNRARYFVGFFGVRELLLAGFLVAARDDPERLSPLAAFGALSDLGDTAVVLAELLRRGRLEPGGLFLLASGAGGSVASLVAWRGVQSDPSSRSIQRQMTSTT
jgi:hypothetical protein